MDSLGILESSSIKYNDAGSTFVYTSLFNIDDPDDTICSLFPLDNTLSPQDMGKVGAIQDLIRGVSKIIPKQSDRINDSILSKVTRNSVTENSLIERAALFIEAENWKDADAYCEKALDINPQNGRAYFYKLMIELRVTSMEQLSKEKKPFDNRKNYQLTLRFSDEDFCERVRSCNRAVYERVEAEERRVFQEQETLLRHLNRTEDTIIGKNNIKSSLL